DAAGELKKNRGRNDGSAEFHGKRRRIAGLLHRRFYRSVEEGTDALVAAYRDGQRAALFRVGPTSRARLARRAARSARPRPITGAAGGTDSEARSARARCRRTARPSRRAAGAYC